MDSKSIGLCPQGFESPRCRLSAGLPNQAKHSRQNNEVGAHASRGAGSWDSPKRYELEEDVLDQGAGMVVGEADL